MPEQKKLSLEPYRGTRDFYPEDQFIQNHIFSTWKKVVESFGYLEYGASILEETELYRAKSGEEIVNEQTYSFTDRGGRDVTIRPEMTPTVARMVAQKRKELTFPLRWYSVPNLFRYERPQRGRLREHWQLNVDLFGVDGVEADAEVISVADGIMRAFGADPKDFTVKLNNRKLIQSLLFSFNLSAEQAHKLGKLLDRSAKLNAVDFDEQARALVGAQVRELKQVIGTSKLSELPEALKGSEGFAELTSLVDRLKAAGVQNIAYDPTLVRGFDYYTGNVFEVFDADPKNPRSLFGGGRYDDLVGIFGVEKVSAFGFGMGDVTTRDFLETHNLLPQYRSTVDLYLAVADPTSRPFAQELARELRGHGVNVAVDLTDRKVSAQVKAADRLKARCVLVVGGQEAEGGTFRLKFLAESRELEVLRSDLAPSILGTTR